MQIDKDYQTYIFGELIQSLHYLFNGRIKKIEVDYLVRQYHSENTYIKLSKKLIDKKKWNDSCELIYNFITKHNYKLINWVHDDLVFVPKSTN